MAAAKQLFYASGARFKDEHFIVMQKRVVELLPMEVTSLQNKSAKRHNKKLNTALMEKLNELALVRAPYIFSVKSSSLYKYQLQLDMVRSTNRYLEIMMDQKTIARTAKVAQINALAHAVEFLSKILAAFKQPLLLESSRVLGGERHAISIVMNINQILFKVNYLAASLTSQIENVDELLALKPEDRQSMESGYASMLEQLASIVDAVNQNGRLDEKQRFAALQQLCHMPLPRSTLNLDWPTFDRVRLELSESLAAPQSLSHEQNLELFKSIVRQMSECSDPTSI